MSDATNPTPTDIDDATTGAAASGYADAITELDHILVELESGDVDVDRLASRVSRAAELIDYCRDRIDRARMTVNDVVADLDEANAASEPSEASDVNEFGTDDAAGV